MSFLKVAIVVGFGGITNGGKTTMSRHVEDLFASDKYNLNVKCLHLDTYFRSIDDPNHRHLDEFNHHDWECLDALDLRRFIDDFCYARSTSDLLIVEGFLIFNMTFPPDDDYQYDLAYFFDLPYEECLRRRLTRNYDPPDPEGYFERHVWPASLKAKQDAFEQNKNMELRIVDTTKESFEAIQAKIVNDIEKLLMR